MADTDNTLERVSDLQAHRARRDPTAAYVAFLRTESVQLLGMADELRARGSVTIIPGTTPATIREPAAPTNGTSAIVKLDYAETIAALRAVARIPYSTVAGPGEWSPLRELVLPLWTVLYEHASAIAPSPEQWERDRASALRCRPKREKHG